MNTVYIYFSYIALICVFILILFILFPEKIKVLKEKLKRRNKENKNEQKRLLEGIKRKVEQQKKDLERLFETLANERDKVALRDKKITSLEDINGNLVDKNNLFCNEISKKVVKMWQDKIKLYSEEHNFLLNYMTISNLSKQTALIFMLEILSFDELENNNLNDKLEKCYSLIADPDAVEGDISHEFKNLGELIVNKLIELNYDSKDIGKELKNFVSIYHDNNAGLIRIIVPTIDGSFLPEQMDCSSDLNNGSIKEILNWGINNSSGAIVYKAKVEVNCKSLDVI